MCINYNKEIQLVTEFYLDKFNIDLSNVKVIDYYDDDNRLGYYEYAFPNKVNINLYKLKIKTSNTKKDVMYINTLVHELAHLVQYEYSTSLILPLDKVSACAISEKTHSKGIVWSNMLLEIDALLFECLFFYERQLLTTDEIIISAIKRLISNMFKDTDKALLSKCIDRLDNNNFKNFVLNALV